MAAITDYDSLSDAISDWDERSYGGDLTDQFIGLAEAEFRLYLGPLFAKEASVTVSFVSGSAALPTGFIRPIALTHATYGGMTEAAIGTIRDARISGGTIPRRYAVTGSTIEVDATFTGDMTFDIDGSLTGLSSLNTTNWLITYAPQAYLSMCLSMAAVRNEDFNKASTLNGAALQKLNDLGIQSTVAQLARATVRIPGMTP